MTDGIETREPRSSVVQRPCYHEVFRKELPEPFRIRLRKWLAEFVCVIIGHRKPTFIKADFLFWVEPAKGWPVGTRNKWTCKRCGRETRS